MRRTAVLALLVALVACSGLVGAQTLTGTITGKVVDQQGGVLPGVTVTLTGRTGSQVQVTDTKGEYRFLGLQPGPYNVKAELQGFRVKEQNVEAGVGRTVEVPLAMVVGGMTETVDVVANAVTIDTTTTATATNMSQDMLFSMPLSHNNPAVNILQYLPGATDGSMFGAAADAGNALMLDGVDTRDPEGGTAWAFYNYNIIEDVQVGGLGQPAEYGGFTGAVINTITKSGGNRFSHLSEIRYTKDSSPFFSDNTVASITQQNPNLGAPARILKMSDYTVQLGGPIKKDKLFFFASIQRYKIEQKISGPIRSEVSPRYNFKITYQPTPSDSIVGSIQYDNYNQQGRTGLVPGYAVTSQSQTIDQDSPEIIYNAQYRKVFGASTFLEGKFTGWWGYYDLNPVSPERYHYDLRTGLNSGGAGYTYQADRSRNQLNVSLSKYAQLAGAHNFKFGVEIERSTIRNRYQYSGTPGAYFNDWDGEPYMAYGYTYDLHGRTKRESYYAQDQWKLANRLTANIGVRLDNIRGESVVTSQELYKTFSVGPRLGFALDLTGKGTSVLKAYYGRLYEGAVFSSWNRAVPGKTDFISYAVGANWSTLTEVSRDEAILQYSVADNIKHPRTDEVNASWEQQVGRSYKLTVTGIYRDFVNPINSVFIGGIWEPFAYNNPKTNQPLTLYRLPSRPVNPKYVIQNTDSVVYQLSNGQTITANGQRKYKGLLLSFQRAYKDRWQAAIHYVYSRTTGTVSNSSGAGFNSNQFATPNTILVNNDGPTPFDRAHVVKVFAGYQIPKIEVSLNGFWLYQSGFPYAAYLAVTRGDTRWTGTLNVNLEPRENNLTDSQTRLDLRAEKVFNIGIHRFGVYADIQNVFNQSAITGVVTRYPYQDLTNSTVTTGEIVSVPFGGPATMMAGRQITFGGRWSF